MNRIVFVALQVCGQRQEWLGRRTAADTRRARDLNCYAPPVLASEAQRRQWLGHSGI